jgi:hypothetical protein
MSERLILKGALQEKRLKAMKLATRAEGIIRSLKIIIQPGSITKLADLKTGEALELITQLHEARKQYLQLKAEIADIEKELG